MHVVYAAAEVVPFAKSGGLGDVAAGLPRALDQLGHIVTVFAPCYRRAWSAGAELTATGVSLRIEVGAQVVDGRVYESRLPGSGVHVYLIDQPGYFDRDGLYGSKDGDYPDNCERFVFFNRAVLETVEALSLAPDIIHCNDWQTGLMPVYLKTLYRRLAENRTLGTLFTIHNLAYLGLFRQWDMTLTGLDWRLFNWRQLEFHGNLSFMKAGLVFGDMLSTVSPTYAKEIQTPRFGSGLDGLLRHRQGDLRGIVNGIDEKVWSPKSGSLLAEPYDATTVETGKARCKAWLQRRAGLAERPDVPLFAQIGRLAPQKGWDLLAKVIDRLLERDVQMVVLGEGQRPYHNLIEDLARRYAGRFWAHLGFSDELAHQIEAGADIFLMPSQFEPCGLSQLYSLAHGTVPVVRGTGGLADTVVDAYPETLDGGTANGFVFTEANPEALWTAIERALALWPDREAWLKLVRTGMSADWSWRHSAREYAELYQEIERRIRSRSARPDSDETSGRPAARTGTVQGRG
jgi:starch synthase